MENYSLLMGAAAVMKMAVEMAAVSMEKPSGGTSPSGGVPDRLLSPGSWLRDGGGSGSRSDSDLHDMLHEDDKEMMISILCLKELEDRAKLLDQRRGSMMGCMCIPRNRTLGHEMLLYDYFTGTDLSSRLFRRRYRMRRKLFETIVKDCEANSNYFKQRRNNADTMGFSPYQKISAAMRVLAYGIPADYTDEYLRIGLQTTTDSVRMFAKMVFKFRVQSERNLIGLRILKRIAILKTH
ncbi:hypothetical protein QYE76_022163 [Lolium multiflorum]|uniref:Uncharacterized protein n=1 Tax=Lolium multiflorum TaxID=4521 RepID=A0AAD8R9R1_LOLMU|nr:hypothetical protein QYE76_022163 [Lolium multiflorum]